MTSDWEDLIAESVNLADRMATQIPPLLASPDLTPEQASTLYDNVNARCLKIEKMIDEMEAAGADQDLLDAADDVDEMWATIAEAIIERISLFPKQ